HANGRALEDPRVRVVLNDGRNFLLLTKRRYDLISIELSSVWFAGTGNLYNREFYQLAGARLNPGGVLQQWVQLHHMALPSFVATLETVRSAFAHVVLFVMGGQGMIVASNERLVADWNQIWQRTSDPKLLSRMRRLGMPNWFGMFGMLALGEGAI